jgi:hypothetical protein
VLLESTGSIGKSFQKSMGEVQKYPREIWKYLRDLPEVPGTTVKTGIPVYAKMSVRKVHEVQDSHG